jgi:hypothetical protein
MSSSVNLLDVFEATSVPSITESKEKISLALIPKLLPQDLKARWAVYNETFNGTILSLNVVPSSLTDITEACAAVGLYTLASGTLPGGGLKLFFYGIHSTGTGNEECYLVQMTILPPSGDVSLIIKSTTQKVQSLINLIHHVFENKFS